MYSVQCTVYSVQCTEYSVQWTVHYSLLVKMCHRELRWVRDQQHTVQPSYTLVAAGLSVPGIYKVYGSWNIKCMVPGIYSVWSLEYIVYGPWNILSVWSLEYIECMVL